jgi:hypothetical protein
MPQIAPYNGKTDLAAFLMSFEAAIQLVGGDESTMSKSFVMAITRVALTWYTTLDTENIRSWKQLWELMFTVKQGINETL